MSRRIFSSEKIEHAVTEPKPAKILISWELEDAALLIQIERGPLDVVYMDPDGKMAEYRLGTDSTFRLLGVAEAK